MVDRKPAAAVSENTQIRRPDDHVDGSEVQTIGRHGHTGFLSGCRIAGDDVLLLKREWLSVIEEKDALRFLVDDGMGRGDVAVEHRLVFHFNTPPSRMLHGPSSRFA
jgi:hypothetical protein